MAKITSIRIPDWLNDLIVALARKEKRSKSNLILKVLEEAVEREDQQSGKQQL